MESYVIASAVYDRAQEQAYRQSFVHGNARRHTQSEFNLKGEIYNREKYLQGIDLYEVREYFKVNPPLPDKSIYYALEEYKKVKQKGTQW